MRAKCVKQVNWIRNFSSWQALFDLIWSSSSPQYSEAGCRWYSTKLFFSGISFLPCQYQVSSMSRQELNTFKQIQKRNENCGWHLFIWWQSVIFVRKVLRCCSDFFFCVSALEPHQWIFWFSLNSLYSAGIIQIFFIFWCTRCTHLLRFQEITMM